MNQYPEISHQIIYGEPIYAFDKLDGSCMRVEWTKKNGFWKWGSRTRLIDLNEKPLGEAIPLFFNKYAEFLEKQFVDNRFQKTICFFEFWGKNSFAGTHKDEEHFTTLFDVSVHKKGLLLPKEFIKITEGIDIAKLLYFGNANSDFENKVHNGVLENMTFEGVVCKGKYKSPGYPIMFKVKNQAWYDKLKNFCNGDQSKYEKLK